MPPDGRTSMTVPPDRNWDAEFDEITRHLTPAQDELRPASRETFGPTDETGIPGFRDSWRLPDEPAPAESTAHLRDIEVPSADAASQDATDHGWPTAEHDDFVPPNPPPLETDDPATVVMVAALVLGPLWACYLLFFDRTAATLWWSCAITLTLVGFAMAVARQPKSRDDESNDDGARV